MDRLPTLIRVVLVGAVCLAAGCGRGNVDEVQRTRVAAVKAEPGATDPRSWCDAYSEPETASAFAPLATEPARGARPAPAVASGRWVWMNFWATWCAPCRREMPMLEAWRTQLERDGIAVDLWYLSLDEDPEELQRFLRQNPHVAPAPSARLTAPEQLGPWLRSWGADGASAIPIHVMVDPRGRVRCVHVGETREGDFPFVKALIG